MPAHFSHFSARSICNLHIAITICNSFPCNPSPVSQFPASRCQSFHRSKKRRKRDAVGGDRALRSDGNLRKLPDEKAKIDAPAVDASAERVDSGQWVFKNLRREYDLVLLLKDRARIEGFQFAPVREFDPFLSADAGRKTTPGISSQAT